MLENEGIFIIIYKTIYYFNSLEKCFPKTFVKVLGKKTNGIYVRKTHLVPFLS